MAVIHQATISPTKQEILDSELCSAVTILGSYRFDDPAGEVGVEGFIVETSRGRSHLVLTYRGAPLGGARLISTMDHSALGKRWVYDGTTDPVALDCLRRAIAGTQAQATLEIWVDGVKVGVREPTLQLEVHSSPTGQPAATEILVLRELDRERRDDPSALVATWASGSAAIAIAAPA